MSVPEHVLGSLGVYLEQMILLTSPEVLSVEVVESGEHFVDVRGAHPRVVVDETRSQISNRSDFFCFGRKSVVERLIRAATTLPDYLCFLLKEAYRPIWRQRKSFEAVQNHYREVFPTIPEEELRGMVSEYVAPVETAPHPSGAALDITLVDRDGNELDLGTAFNAEPADTENRTYLASPLVDGRQRERRLILSEALSSVGFVNYPTEWWHWSYGDRYWACLTGQNALYGQVLEAELPDWIEGRNQGPRS